MSQTQIKMHRERIKSIGISILGGNSGVEGKYELGIDSIGLVNEEDVVDTLSRKFHAYSESLLTLRLQI